MPQTIEQETQPAEAIVLLAIVIVGFVGLYRWRADRSYIGSSRPATLEWYCPNTPFWSDPEVDYLWEGTDTRAFPEVERSPDEPLSTNRAVGTLRFDDYDHATFISDEGGGSTVLIRQEAGQQHYLKCAAGAMTDS
jgi:hypothetical protein